MRRKQKTMPVVNRHVAGIDHDEFMPPLAAGYTAPAGYGGPVPPTQQRNPAEDVLAQVMVTNGVRAEQ